MCQNNNNTKNKKGKHLKYSERQAIERWFNRDKRTKVEIANLLDRTEKTIRNEIKRGLVKNLTSELIEIWVYSADVAQQRYEYYLKAKGPKLKIDNDYELKEYVEKSIKEDKKSPEVIAKEIKKMNFKTKMCGLFVRSFIKSIPRPLRTSFSVARIYGSLAPSQSKEVLSIDSAKSQFG